MIINEDEMMQNHMLSHNENMQGTCELTCLFMRTFASCGSLPDAMWIFRSLEKKNVFSWSTIISIHSRINKFEHTLSLYYEMVRSSSIRPDFRCILAALKACSALSSLQNGKIVHDDAVWK